MTQLEVIEVSRVLSVVEVAGELGSRSSRGKPWGQRGSRSRTRSKRDSSCWVASFKFLVLASVQESIGIKTTGLEVQSEVSELQAPGLERNGIDGGCDDASTLESEEGDQNESRGDLHVYWIIDMKRGWVKKA